MQIFTSYFANTKNLPSDIVPVSIALKTPSWFLGVRYKLLAPTGAILSAWKAHQDNSLYLQQYDSEVLSHLDVFKVYKDLEHISGGKDVALLCYERPGEFCHRIRTAGWFSERGIPVFEWKGPAQAIEVWEQQRWF